MRKWVVLALLVLTTGCKKGGVVEGDVHTAQAPQEFQATKLAPGEWEITTVTPVRPGAPGQPDSSIATAWLSVEDALNPPPEFFGACRTGTLDVSGGSVRGAMPCHGDGAMSNASMSVSGTYRRDRFDVTIDLRFMGMTLRQEKRGRFVRPL
jgi:hypothetical protein